MNSTAKEFTAMMHAKRIIRLISEGAEANGKKLGEMASIVANDIISGKIEALDLAIFLNTEGLAEEASVLFEKHHRIVIGSEHSSMEIDALNYFDDVASNL